MNITKGQKGKNCIRFEMFHVKVGIRNHYFTGLLKYKEKKILS